MELVSALRFERVHHGTPFSYPAPFSQGEPRYTSFERGPKIGFPTREEADEIAHEGFVMEFPSAEDKAAEERRRRLQDLNDDLLYD